MSYHNLHIQTTDIPRTSIFDLPFSLMITCTRAAGWELWQTNALMNFVVIAGEFAKHGLRLDVNGVVIVDSLTQQNNEIRASCSPFQKL